MLLHVMMCMGKGLLILWTGLLSFHFLWNAQSLWDYPGIVFFIAVCLAINDCLLVETIDRDDTYQVFHTFFRRRRLERIDKYHITPDLKGNANDGGFIVAIGEKGFNPIYIFFEHSQLNVRGRLVDHHTRPLFSEYPDTSMGNESKETESHGDDNSKSSS